MIGEFSIVKVIIFILIIWWLGSLIYNKIIKKIVLLTKRSLKRAKWKREADENVRLSKINQEKAKLIKKKLEPEFIKLRSEIELEVKKYDENISKVALDNLKDKYGIYPKDYEIKGSDFDIGITRIIEFSEEEKNKVAIDYIEQYNNKTNYLNEIIEQHREKVTKRYTQIVNPEINNNFYVRGELKLHDYIINRVSEIKIPQRKDFSNKYEYDEEYQKLLNGILEKPFFHKEYKAVIPYQALKMHSHIIGGTGSGKTELLKKFIHENIKKGNAVFALDPHGDFVTECAKFNLFNPNYANKLVYISPEFDCLGKLPVFNPFEHDYNNLPDYYKQSAISKKVTELKNAFEIIFDTDFTHNMSLLVKNCMMILFEREGSTLLDLLNMMIPEKSKSYIDTGLCHWDENIRDFFKYQFNKSAWDVTKKAIYTRFSEAFSNKSLKYMLTGSKSSFKFTELLDNGYTVLVNSSQGLLTQDGSKIFGAFLVTQVTSHALERVKRNNNKRTPIFTYIDECQNFMTPSITKMLEETRKYGLYLNLAHQHLGQFRSNGQIKDSVMSNTEVKIIGKSSYKDKKTFSSSIGFDFNKNVDSFKPGVFVLKAGEQKRAIIIKTYRNLILKYNVGYGGREFNNYLSPSEWNKLKNAQLDRFYRDITLKPETSVFSTDSRNNRKSSHNINNNIDKLENIIKQRIKQKEEIISQDNSKQFSPNTKTNKKKFKFKKPEKLI
jgi:hypothetical protein